MPPRAYDPLYDNPLGPMGEKPTDPEDPGYLGPFPHPVNRDRDGVDVGVGVGVADADTVSALNTLFGESVAQQEHLDHHEHDHEHHREEHEQNVNAAPTLASHHAILSEPRNGNGNGTGNPDLSLVIDPALSAGQTNTGSAGSSPAAPTKRKATSRANMLARGGACEFCKRRKLKCSAEVPTCANCVKLGRECVYSQKKQRSRVRVLEDRLQELEKRLGPQTFSTASASASDSVTQDPGTSGSTATSGLGHTPAENEPFYDGFTLSTLDEHALGLSPEKGKELHPNQVQGQVSEPDVLMTLADAAAGNSNAEAEADAQGHAPKQADHVSEPWDGLSPEQVITEILKSVAGGKGIGEKIIAHLIQFYITPPSIPDIHVVVPPTTLIARLSNKTQRPVHPTLLLSLLVWLTPRSPSPALSHPSIPSLLLQHARTHQNHAVVNADPRMLDMGAACTLRGYWLINEARYFEAWTEIAQATGLMYATGLTKLGHVGERFVKGIEVPGREQRVEMEKRRRWATRKSQLVVPAETSAELGERINLFWFEYLNDRGASAAWGHPSAYNDEDITTPWPKDEYESAESLLDIRTIYDFLNGPTIDDASKDSTNCAMLKGLTLMYHAKRLLDLPESVATPERHARLMRVTKGYMATLPPITHERYLQGVEKFGELVHAWLFLHAAVAMLHAKSEVDSTYENQVEHFVRFVESAGKMLEVMDDAQRCGDMELEGCNLIGAAGLSMIGSNLSKYLNRALKSADPRLAEAARYTDLEGKKAGFLNALGLLGKRVRFAAVAVQLVSNIGLGSELKFGEYERPDNM